MILKCENLSCGYENKIILESINFEIDKGQLWCILGANGIGKSTLFKTILGLLKPVSGKVKYLDREITKWNRKELAKVVSYVPQNHIPPFPFRVIDVLMMGRHPFQSTIGSVKKEDIDAVKKALNMLQIEHLADRVYTQISGGERQLVLLARAIVQDTPLMILDEPVSNLDFGNHAKVIQHIRNLVKMGKSIVMTTHEPDHAFIEEGNVIIMQSQKQISIGNGRELVDEKCIRDMYGVENKILTEVQCGQKTCISIYK